MNPETMNGILDRYERKPSELLQILQDVQGVERWLAPESLEQVAAGLGVPLAKVYRLASFFKSLSLSPRGEHVCQVCIGTTCHVRGAPRLVDKVELELGIKEGETTADMAFTLETVGCVGACALGPLVVIDGEYHGNMTTNELGKALSSLGRQRVPKE